MICPSKTLKMAQAQFNDQLKDLVTAIFKRIYTQPHVLTNDIKFVAELFHVEKLWDMLEANYNSAITGYRYEQKGEIIELVKKGWTFENAIRAVADDDLSAFDGEVSDRQEQNDFAHDDEPFGYQGNMP